MGYLIMSFSTQDIPRWDATKLKWESETKLGHISRTNLTTRSTFSVGPQPPLYDFISPESIDLGLILFNGETEILWKLIDYERDRYLSLIHI